MNTTIKPATAPVTVYSKPSCVQCDATYRALNKIGVKYTVVDVTQDQAAYQHIVDLGYQQVPVVETSDTHWSGYRPDLISELVLATQPSGS